MGQWTSSSFYMGEQHDIRGRPSVSVWTYNKRPWTNNSYCMDVHMTSLDVHQFLYRRRTCDRGRPSVSIWTYNIRFVDKHQFLYRRLICDSEGPPVSIQTYNMTSTSCPVDVKHVTVDVHQFLYRRTT